MKEFKGIYYLHGKLNEKMDEALNILLSHNELNIPSSPKVDIVIKQDFIDIYADLPGVGIDDFKVYLADDKLIIEGAKNASVHTEKVNYLIMEREFFPFRKVIYLPFEVGFDKGFAKLKDGVLHIRLERLS